MRKANDYSSLFVFFRCFATQQNTHTLFFAVVFSVQNVVLVFQNCHCEAKLLPLVAAVSRQKSFHTKIVEEVQIFCRDETT